MKTTLKYFLYISIFVMFLNQAWGGNITNEKKVQPMNTIFGKVVSTGPSIEGVIVTIKELNISKPVNKDGSYEFTNIDSNKYTIVPSKEGVEFLPPSAAVRNYNYSDKNATNFIVTEPGKNDFLKMTLRKINCNFKKIVWSGKKFVAICEFGVILSSENGRTWIIRKFENSSFSDVAYSGKRFVVVGNMKGKVLSSPDGEIWNEHDLNIEVIMETKVVGGVEFGKSNRGTTYHRVYNGFNTNQWFTSDDKLRLDLNSHETMSSVIWTGDQFVTTGTEGSISTSSDGMSWTTRSLGIKNGIFLIAWSGNYYLAIENATYERTIFYTSYDAVEWKRHEIKRKQLHGNKFTNAYWDGEKFLLIGYDSGWNVTYFSEKELLIETEKRFYSGSLRGIAGNGAKVVAVGFHGEINLSQDNGKTWNTIETNKNNNLEDVVWTGMEFVAVGENGVVLTSKDGAVWQSRHFDGEDPDEKPSWESNTNTINYVGWECSQFVAVGGNGFIMTSPDGIYWKRRKSGTTKSLNNVKCLGNLFIVLGDESTILTSPDGADWTMRNHEKPTSKEQKLRDRPITLYNVAWSGRLYVAIGHSWPSRGDVILERYISAVYTSPDGVTWSKQRIKFILMKNAFNKIFWIGNTFVAVGGNNVISSADGVDWSRGWNPGKTGTRNLSGKNILHLNDNRYLYITYKGEAIKGDITYYNNLFLGEVFWTGSLFLNWGHNEDGNYVILLSPDGITWSANQVFPTLLWPNASAWSGKRLVSAGFHRVIFSSQ